MSKLTVEYVELLLRIEGMGKWLDLREKKKLMIGKRKGLRCNICEGWVPDGEGATLIALLRDIDTGAVDRVEKNASTDTRHVMSARTGLDYGTELCPGVPALKSDIEKEGTAVRDIYVILMNNMLIRREGGVWKFKPRQQDTDIGYLLRGRFKDNQK